MQTGKSCEDNRTPSQPDNKTPYERALKRKPADYHRLFKFGSKVYVHARNTSGQKFKPKATVCYYLGLPPNQPGILIWNPARHINKVHTARNYDFLASNVTITNDNVLDDDDDDDVAVNDAHVEPNLNDGDMTNPHGKYTRD